MMKIDKEIFNLIKRTKKRLNKLIRTKYFLFGTLGGLFVGAIINGVAIFVSMYYSLWFSLGAVFLGMILGEIVASHVIPRPHGDVEKILPQLK